MLYLICFSLSVVLLKKKQSETILWDLTIEREMKLKVWIDNGTALNEDLLFHSIEETNFSAKYTLSVNGRKKGIIKKEKTEQIYNSFYHQKSV